MLARAAATLLGTLARAATATDGRCLSRGCGSRGCGIRGDICATLVRLLCHLQYSLEGLALVGLEGLLYVR